MHILPFSKNMQYKKKLYTMEGIGNSQTWIADSQQTILVNATPSANGEVTGMNVSGPSSWSRQQTESYCSQFLPNDASEFNRVKDSINTLIDYHSSVGEVVMTVLDQGSCLLNIAQS